MATIRSQPVNNSDEAVIFKYLKLYDITNTALSRQCVVLCLHHEQMMTAGSGHFERALGRLPALISRRSGRVAASSAIARSRRDST
jgi:hypothetical protein